MKALLGTKLGMTQLFDEAGNVMRVTVIAAGPCIVTQIKTKTTDGYNAIQLGYGNSKQQKRSLMGHLKSSNSNAKFIREFRLKDTKAGDEAAAEIVLNELGLTVGDSVDVKSFELGDSVQVTGTSKGKGFAGTIKRHNFARGPKSHGSRNYREPGSIGAGFPQHVFRGQKMAGRMGGDQVTVKNLKVMVIDAEQNLLAVSGAIPGPKRGLVMVKGL